MTEKKELHIFIFGTIHWSYNFTPFIYKCFVTFSWSFHCFV